MDKICTEKIVSKSFKFIKKYALKLLLENNNKFFSFHFSPAWPSSPAALGLASSPSAAQLARSARSRVSPQRSRISTVRHIRRLSGDFARSKGQLTSAPENPRAHFLSSSPPLSVAAKTAATEESRAGGPLRRRRPPRRRACSPTGEHAAVERPGRGAPLVEPGEPAPWLGFFSDTGEKPVRLFFFRAGESSSDAP